MTTKDTKVFKLIDMRKDNNINKMKIVQPSLRKNPGQQKSQGMVQGEFDKEIQITLAMIFKQLWKSLQKPITALKYRLLKLNWTFLSRVKVPWFKVVVILLAGFVLLKKDMQFNIALKSPLSYLSDTSEEESADEQLAQKVAYDDNGNPYAPVSKGLSDDMAKAFIKKYAPIAINEMEKYGVPASIKMGQAMIESRAGTSRLAVNNNNFFGMKCFSTKCKKGHCTNATDDHHKDFFRSYKEPSESWRAHSKLITNGRYSGLKKHKLDYKAWAKGLKAAGYATDKIYDKKLIRIIEKYKLYKLDDM